jgi:hypothetical protein
VATKFAIPETSLDRKEFYFSKVTYSARTGERRNAYRILVGKPGRKGPLGRPRRVCEDNIKTGLREMGWGGVDWIYRSQDRDQWRALVNMIMNLWIS